MDATGIGTGHNDSFVYQARAFLDEVAGRDELPRNASFADGLHALLLEEAVVRAATQNAPTPLRRATMSLHPKLVTAVAPEHSSPSPRAAVRAAAERPGAARRQLAG